MNDLKEVNDGPKKFLALGDSYTIGESVTESQRWPVLLVDTLKKMGVRMTPVEIIAVTGWTTDELRVGITKQEPIDKDYDLVSLLIGVNNQFRGRSVDNFKEEFEELLEQAIAYAGSDAKKVFVVSIPDWGVTPFAKKYDAEKIAMEIDAYNAVCQQVASEKGVSYFDITAISRQKSTTLELIAEDGLHPSGEMYKQWVSLMISDVAAKLEK